MSAECYGQTRPQDGRSRNEDAFVILRRPVLVAAVCDGAGNAEQVARRALRLFGQLVAASETEQLLRDETWVRWVRQIDLALLGGSESTFVGAAVIGDEIVGAAAGDSRAYHLGTGGSCSILTPRCARLGSGECAPVLFRRRLGRHDVVLLMSDGAWSPLSPFLLRRAVQRALGGHFSEVPAAVLEAAGRTGRWDDMTVVALRVAR